MNITLIKSNQNNNKQKIYNLSIRFTIISNHTQFMDMAFGNSSRRTRISYP